MCNTTIFERTFVLYALPRAAMIKIARCLVFTTKGNDSNKMVPSGVFIEVVKKCWTPPSPRFKKKKISKRVTSIEIMYTYYSRKVVTTVTKLQRNDSIKI